MTSSPSRTQAGWCLEDLDQPPGKVEEVRVLARLNLHNLASGCLGHDRAPVDVDHRDQQRLPVEARPHLFALRICLKTWNDTKIHANTKDNSIST